MEKLRINGGRKLEGKLSVQGAKNSVLPILAASILINGETTLENCPELKDVDAAISILQHLGCKVTRREKEIHIDSSQITTYEIPDHLMREMRSSVIFLGAILARTGHAILSMPGGCELGPRPIDLHLAALRELGAEIEETGGNIICHAPQLVGGKINLSSPSVGATENAMLAALFATGQTIITNAAKEPEIVDLQNFLLAAGANIRGAGQSTIFVENTKLQKQVRHKIIPDRIVTATYLSAVALTGGQLELEDIVPEHVATVSLALKAAGCDIDIQGSRLKIRSKGRLEAITPVITRPYPGFPTDAQPCLLAASTCFRGTTVFIENIFQNRYRYVEELRRMGANIKLEGRVAVVSGVRELTGANVSATDLRGGAALVVAALGAKGETVISEISHIDRGYDDFEFVLSSLGADIRRTEE